MRTFGHIFATLFRAFVRIFFTAIFCGALGVGVTLLVAYVNSKHWPPDTLTWIAAIAVGVLALYAGGVTVLMSEAVHAVQEAVKDVEKDAGGAIGTAAHVAQEIEKRM